MTISPPKFDFKGDREKSISLKAQARQFYNFIANQAELGGLNSISRSVVLPDGSTVSVYSKKDNITGLRTGKVVINTSKSKIGSVEELEALIIQLAVDGAEEGWGKPYITSPGTVDGHNPWMIIKTDEDATTITNSKGLDVSYFTNNDEITYSLSPNIGNCYWGDTEDKVITWVGPYNQIGPIDIDGDSSYGGTLSDAYLTNAGIAIGSPTNFVYISDQFSKKVFKNKSVIAEFPNYVLAACESTGSLGPCIIALTATSLSQCASLHYKIEVFWIIPSTYEVKLDINMELQYSLFPTYAGAFNLTGTECIVAFQLNYLSPPSTTKYITLDNKIRQLKIDLSNLSSITYSISTFPLPTGADVHKRIYASIGYSDVTSVSTQIQLLTYGYDYSNNSIKYAYIILARNDYFSGAPYYTSHLQIGSNIYLLGTLSDPHYSFNYQTIYGASPPLPGTWFYPDSGLSVYNSNIVYSNIQRNQLGILYWTTTRSTGAVPTGSFMPVRESAHYLNISNDRLDIVGILSDDYMTRNDFIFSDSWPLGSSNTYSNPIKTSLSPSEWIDISVAITNSFNEVIPCKSKVNGVIATTPGTSGDTNYLAYKQNSKQHLYFNGVSHKKYAIGSFNLKGPFSWYYQTDYSFPIPTDYSGNFKVYFQAATDTTAIVPSGYKPIKDISGSLGMSSQTTPRIKRSRILPQVI